MALILILIFALMSAALAALSAAPVQACGFTPAERSEALQRLEGVIEATAAATSPGGHVYVWRLPNGSLEVASWDSKPHLAPWRECTERQISRKTAALYWGCGLPRTGATWNLLKEVR